jgi:hypothetical protein
MQIGFLLEDRDTAYVFTDTANMPEDAQLMTLDPCGFSLEEAGDEDRVQWLEMNDNKFRLTLRAEFDYENADYDVTGCPIPSPIVMKDAEAYEAALAE